MTGPGLSPREYQILVEHAPMMIWRAGVDARCDYFNATWLRFTGRALGEELGEGWVDGVHPEDRARCVARYREHFERRETFELEFRMRRHDGAYRWLFDRGVPNVVDDRFAGFIGTCIDVDDRRRAARERQEALEREQEARRQAEALAAEVAAQCKAMEKTVRALRAKGQG